LIQKVGDIAPQFGRQMGQLRVGKPGVPGFVGQEQSGRGVAAAAPQAGFLRNSLHQMEVAVGLEARLGREEFGGSGDEIIVRIE
jgi:hypothetical protein